VAREVDPARLVEQARDGDGRAVARLVTLVESDSPQLREVMKLLAPHTGSALTVGLTGSPGVGKSTTTAALVLAYRSRGQRVGVVAVDPSSPFSGGALLGDRVRMQDVATDPGVYIRSMATRGHLGGLSRATPQAVRVLDAAGCDVVLIETVGVGQSEVEVAGLADTTVVLLAPGMGDGIQAAKAGILEIGDVFSVNKADRDGAAATVREIQHMLGLGEARRAGDWRPVVVKTVATKPNGVDDLVEAVDKHQAWLGRDDELHTRRVTRTAREVESIAVELLRARMGEAQPGEASLAELAADVVAGRLDPYAAADRLLESVAESSPS
jgi:LAO/AO transport system kinase